MLENRIAIFGDRNNEFMRAYQNLTKEQRNTLNKVLYVILMDGYPLNIYEMD